MRSFFFFLCFLPLLLGGQVPDNYDQLKKEWDVVLPPESYQPATPTVYSLATGNWGPALMGIEAAYDRIAKAATRPVYVFIFDTGADFDNSLLDKVEDLSLAKSFTGEPTSIDRHGHSTHCGGIVGATHSTIPLGAARMLGDRGLLRIVPIKVLNDSGSGSYTWIHQGTVYATEQARKLIEKGYFVIFSYSLGGSSKSAELEAALKSAWEAGVLIVAAAGNTGAEGIQYPGSGENTLSTASLQQEGNGVNRSLFSTFGAEQFQAAPGSNILSTYKGNQLVEMSGTSMATPHMAAVYAILASVFPDATNEQLVSHFKRYATDLGAEGWDKYFGWGWPVIGKLLDNKPGTEPDPEPEPEPDPDPPAPDKTYIASPGFSYPIIYKAQDETTYHTANVEYVVEFSGNEGFEIEYDQVMSAIDKFHLGRFLILLKGSDMNDAAFYTAYFLEMLAPKQYGVSVDVKWVKLSVRGYSVELTDPITKNSTKKIGVSYQDGGALFLNTGAFTYKRW